MRKFALILIGFMFLATGSAMVQENGIYLPNVKGTITVPADIAMIRVDVQSTNNNSTMASVENAVLLKKTIDALTAVGVNKDNISSEQSTGVSTGQFSRIVCNKVNNNTICKSESNSKNVLTSTKIIRLKTTDQSFVNTVLRAAQSAGASAKIYSYSLSDPSSAEAQAREMAIANAKPIAERMASQKGANLGKVQGVISGGEYVTNSDQLGMVDVTSIIGVSYELK